MAPWAPPPSAESRSRALRLAAVSTCLAALSCVAVAGTRPTPVQAATGAETTMTLHLVGGGLDLQVEGITTLPTGDGSTVYHAVLDVDDATGSGNGWLVTVAGPLPGLQVLSVQAGCLTPSSCVPARLGSPADGQDGHVLVSAQPDSGMGRQRVEVVFEIAGASIGAPWSFSVAAQV